MKSVRGADSCWHLSFVWKKRVWDEGCVVQGVESTLIHQLAKEEQERKQHCALCLHGSGGLIWSREAAHAAPTEGKKLENPVEKEILMENPWRKQRRRRRKTNLSAAEDEGRDREVRGWKKKKEGDRKRGGGPSGRAAERHGEGEGGEESGRGREEGGVIVGGRGGDSLVDGQKDKGKRGEWKGIWQWAG